MAPYDDFVNEQRYVDQLTRLGLTMYEAKAYLALTRRGSSTAAEVARIAGVPRQRIYDVLAELVERGHRGAQLESGIRAGRLQLGAVDESLGTTASTFYDRAVSDVFETSMSPMLCVAFGQKAPRS